MHNTYTTDSIRAVDAKFEAQKIAFAPLCFQAALAARNLGVLRAVSDLGEGGATREELTTTLGLSPYGVGVLLEICLGMGILKLAGAEDGYRYVLGKIGYFILEDEMTQVNMNFVQDVCYRGAFRLEDSIRSGSPKGLEVFGSWNTIYEGLADLPEDVRRSWFEFDHYYSDIAFPEALPIVFSSKPGRLYDIGGNTAKWAIASCRFDPDVRVTIVDLPGQVADAWKNIAVAGLTGRVDAIATDMLDSGSTLPPGADAVWMSQFLDCFALEEVEAILGKIARAVDDRCDVWILEPFWDMQRFEASSYSLQATSLYFACMANGNSKMYRSGELVKAVRRGGFELKESHHNLGANDYSLMRFRKARS